MLILYYKNGEQMSIVITGYDALCNAGGNIDDIYKKFISGDNTCFDIAKNYIKNCPVRIGVVSAELPEISEKDFNIRCNRLILKVLERLEEQITTLKTKYSANRIGIVAATTNSGVEEFEKSQNPKHYELGNPAKFLHKYLNLEGFYTTVSTACSSGIRAFSTVRDLIRSNISDAVIVVSVDSIAKVPLFGFNSLEVLSGKPSVPFSKNRSGMNIGEGCAIFIVEKDAPKGIEISGIGESSDIYHSTTPDPEAKESIKAINQALQEAKIQPNEIDYINAHGTGTVSNDIMEAKAIHKVFGTNTPVSSTKPLTGHCLGASAGVETALCCKLLESFDGRLYPHIYDGEYDPLLPKINLTVKDKSYDRCKVCMCNSFGFGGTNAILILRKKDE